MLFLLLCLSRLGRETWLSKETSLSLEERLYRKGRLDWDSKLNRDIRRAASAGPLQGEQAGQRDKPWVRGHLHYTELL